MYQKEVAQGMKCKKDARRRTNVRREHLTQQFMFCTTELDAVISGSAIKYLVAVLPYIC